MYTFERMNHEHLVLQNNYRWLNVTTCRFAKDNSHDYSEVEFFRDLIDDPVYHDCYLTPDSWLEDSVDAHGPYSITRISPSTFKSLTFQDFHNDILQVLSRPDYDLPSEEMVRQVKDVIASVPKLAHFYKLDLQHDRSKFEEDDFILDFDWSFFLYEFVEFIAVDVEQEQISWIVFGLD